MMLSLQNRGCHNINLVSPTHVVPQILEALGVAKAFQIPSLARRISTAEFQEAIELAHRAGLNRLDRARPIVLKL